jgi:opacity protein-like surface antigen
MKRILLAAAAALSISTAFAADISTKAVPYVPPNPCQIATATTPLSCSGFYVGGGIAGQGSNADILGGGLNGSVFAGGMVPTIDAGYLHAQGNWVFGFEFDAGYSVHTNASVGNAAGTVSVGGNINGFRLTELIKVGGNLAALFGTQTPITVPASLSNAIISPYVAIGISQWQLPGAWANGTVGGAGLLFDIGPQWIGDIRYSYTNFNSAAAGLKTTIQNDQSVMATISYKFK